MKLHYFLLPVLLGLTACSVFHQQPSAGKPGKYGDVVLLSNGWKLRPAGTHTEIGTMPLHLVITKDEKYAITSNSGMEKHTLSVIDIEKKQEIQRFTIDRTFRGLAINDAANEVYASAGNNNGIDILDFHFGVLKLKDSIRFSTDKKERISVTGLAFDKTHSYILAVTKENNKLYVVDLRTKTVKIIIPMSAECFDVILKKDNSSAYISLWGGKSVAEVDLNKLEVTRTFATGDHPCDIVLSKDEKYLFSANANNNSVSVIDLLSGKTIETLIVSLTPDSPYGSTPNSVCISPDGTKLLIANADNNYLAVFDIRSPGQSRSLGFIPTAWYPTACRMTSGGEILVASAKGLSSLPNPQGPSLVHEESKTSQYIAYLLKSTVSFIDYPDDASLAMMSSQVYANTPYVQKKEAAPVNQHVLPAAHTGIPSDKIKHVFYIMKENRTYDQVYGDMLQGNGDSSLAIFGKTITPNQHKIAEQFTLFDNYYADAEVSADGHNWSTAAYATDFVEKNWPVMYGDRGGDYDFEGGVPIAAPSSGYIWTAVLKKGLSFRDYGEFVESNPKPEMHYEGRDENIKPFVCSAYPCFDLAISDLLRYDIWEKDFTHLGKVDSVPSFSFIRLPNDHTCGSQKGSLTPQAYVAQNDYAVGKIIERISKSPVWKESLILITEDDAQNGSDHVDAHRSTLLMISPYMKRGFVDHTMYSTSSILKTIELALGLKPMTQFDLSASPILAPLNDAADYSPFHSVEPLIDIEQLNASTAYGSDRCATFNLKREDAIPDIEFNEIIWKNIRGAASQMPAPVRGSFVKIIEHAKSETDND